MVGTPEHHEAPSGLHNDFLDKGASRVKNVYSIAEEEDFASLCSRLAVVEENLANVQTLAMPSIIQRVTDVTDSLENLGSILVKYQHEIVIKVQKQYLGLKEQMQRQDEKIEGELHELELKVAQSGHIAREQMQRQDGKIEGELHRLEQKVAQSGHIAREIDAEGGHTWHLFKDEKQSLQKGASVTSKASTSIDDAFNATDLESNMELNKLLLDTASKCMDDVRTDLTVQALMTEKQFMSLETVSGAQTKRLADGLQVCPVTNNPSAEIKQSQKQGLLQQVRPLPEIGVPQLSGGGSIQRQTFPQGPRKSPQRSRQQSPLKAHTELEAMIKKAFNSAGPLCNEALPILQHASLQPPLQQMSAGMEASASLAVLTRACNGQTTPPRGCPQSMHASAEPRRHTASPMARTKPDFSWIVPPDRRLSSSSSRSQIRR